MSPHVAIRLAVRPLRGAALLDQLVAASPSARRPFSSFRPPPPSHSWSLCLRCSIQARTGPRLFSTVPPPKQPENDTKTTPSSPTQDESPAEPPKSQSHTPPAHEPELPSTAEDRRTRFSARFSTFMDNLQTRALNATQAINDLTGYTAIEAIKARNVELETKLAAAQSRLHAARQNYKSLTSHRAATQREVTTLLARKDTWSPPDLERFTTLYRLDHELEAQVAAASAELTGAEADDARLAAELNAGILKRYHEEQIWSDRIRRQSTWGTWGLMGVNVLLFLVLQFVAEPWRRARLVKGVAEKEKAVMDEVRRELAEVRAALEASGLRDSSSVTTSREPEPEPPVVELVEDGVVTDNTAAEATAEEWSVGSWSWKEILADPVLLRAAVADLYSDRRIDIRMRDISLVALEGAVAGAAVVGSLAFVWIRGR
ncbi:Mdm33 family-domain-containing protein [Echria macrotheca]|uniref:Sensitive to high expression protein 9, mitochondrial n=1 Tax=Echria macrotheca TaxID=438768 RepID=A0AAJ0B6Q4_9PEZI|nr:Mdm33 family-domain-containing protein [Echria macrotheca]